MKLLKFIKRYPFLLMIAISTLILGAIGFAGRKSIYSDYSVELLKTPQLSVVFEGVGEGKYPWVLVERKQESEQVLEEQFQASEYMDKTAAARNTLVSADDKEMDTLSAVLAADEVQGDDAINDSTNNKTGNEADGSDNIENEVADKGKDGQTSVNTETKIEASDNASISMEEKEASSDSNDINPDSKNSETSISNKNSAPAKTDTSVDNTKYTDTYNDNSNNEDSNNARNKNLKSEPDLFQTVTKDYFDDALFIGDSRTVGLSEYSGWTNTTFYADIGLTIYDIFDKKIADINKNKVTILEALKDKQFKKIYIMVGINELGRGTTETFIDEYKKVVVKIQELQPDAIIFVEGIMKVSKEKSDVDPIFNNSNIKEKNDTIASIADDSDIFYIDVNEAITDKIGNLPSKYTFDYIHLKAAYYQLWTDFLLEHGVIIN